MYTAITETQCVKQTKPKTIKIMVQRGDSYDGNTVCPLNVSIVVLLKRATEMSDIYNTLHAKARTEEEKIHQSFNCQVNLNFHPLEVVFAYATLNFKWVEIIPI